MNPVRQAIRFAMQTVIPRRLLLVRGPRSPQRDPHGEEIPGSVGFRPEIALTFDDGPHPEYTPRLLDELARLEMKATFFVIGFDAARHPELIQRMVREGHRVGNHTWMHTEPAETGTTEFLEEISRTRSLLEDLTGMDCTLVRPPKGKLTPGKLVGLWQQRQTAVLWNVDPKDYLLTSGHEITSWAQRLQCRQGDVILLHDSRPWAIRALALLAASGVRAVTIADWLHRTPAGQQAEEIATAGHGAGSIGNTGREIFPDTIPLPDRETGPARSAEVISRYSAAGAEVALEEGREELATLPMSRRQQVRR